MTKILKNNNKLNRKNYFSSANTCFGTLNYSEKIFNLRNFDKIYIVKGVFAQNFISKIAEKYSCECFLNPINPEKTDGIIINKTAVIESSLASFNDSLFPAVIINLGEFCDESLLNQNKEQIFQITEKSQELYHSAQKFLNSANELSEYLLDLSKKYLNEKKLISAIDRISDKHINTKSNNQQAEYRFINSTSSNILDTLENNADKIFYISNEYFAAFHFMPYIAEKLKGSKIICPDALNPKRIRAVYLKEDNILFTPQFKAEKFYNDKYNYINMERFTGMNLKKEHKQKLKFIKKIYDSLIGEAADCFTDLKSLNLELEKIYTSALDINAQQKFTTDFMKKL